MILLSKTMFISLCVYTVMIHRAAITQNCIYDYFFHLKYGLKTLYMYVRGFCASEGEYN